MVALDVMDFSQKTDRPANLSSPQPDNELESKALMGESTSPKSRAERANAPHAWTSGVDSARRAPPATASPAVPSVVRAPDMAPQLPLIGAATSNVQ
jgi:hypothetical protein